jgi:hypothetical protein
MTPAKPSRSTCWGALFVGVGLLISCGGQSAQGNSGASAGSAAEGGSSGAAGAAGNATGGGRSGPCPSVQPVNGSACTAPYPSSGTAECTYGDDPRPECRTRAVCDSGAWQISSARCATPPFPAACPTAAPAQASACSDASLACWYDDGTRCSCSGCAGGSEYPICRTIDPPQWHCDSPGPDCPIVIPQSGTACNTPGASCGPDCTLTVTCIDGLWQWGAGMCPICAAPDTPIATPDGEQPIASLRVGDLVYSQDHDAIVAVPLLKAEHTLAERHHVVRVVLEDGRALEISPGHPTADGRTFGDLGSGTYLDTQHRVRSVTLIPYTHDATFDILPASSSGTYFAAGALIGSTLFRR